MQKEIFFARHKFTSKLLRPIALTGYPICQILCFFSLFLIIVFILPYKDNLDSIYLRNVHLVMSLAIFYIWLIGLLYPILNEPAFGIIYSLICFSALIANISVVSKASEVVNFTSVIAGISYDDINFYNLIFFILCFKFIKDKEAAKYFLIESMPESYSTKDLFYLTRTLNFWIYIPFAYNETISVYRKLLYGYRNLNYNITAEKVEKLISLEEEIYKLRREVLTEDLDDIHFEFKDIGKFSKYIERNEIIKKTKL